MNYIKIYKFNDAPEELKKNYLQMVEMKIG